MRRLIDADKLVEYIRENGILGSYYSDTEREDYVIDVIESQPVVNDWIPCSEKLPEESGKYEVTAYNGYRYQTTQVRWQPKLKSWSLSGAMAYWKIIAWQPLPEPYNPERSGK